MGLPRLLIEAKLKPFSYKKFTVIIKVRSRIKVFEAFEDSSKNGSIINTILISYGCVLGDQTIHL